MSFLLDLTPLRTSPSFRRLWWGLGISNFGTQLTVVAVGLQVYAITRSTLAVGVLGVCALVPLVVLGLYGGALVDTYDRRKVALASSFGLWLVVILLAVQAWLHLDSVPLLYGLVALQSAGFAINNPARSAIIPRLVEPLLLPAANVLQTVLWNVALTVGPLLGAVPGRHLGLRRGVHDRRRAVHRRALGAVAAARPAPGRGADGAKDEGGTANGNGKRRGRGFWMVLDGLRYLATRPNVRMTFLVDLIAMIFAMPRVLYPAVGVLIIGGGAMTTGILGAAFAVGAVLAGLFSGGLVRIRRQGRVIAAAILAFGLAVTGFGLVLVITGPTSPGNVLVGSLLAAMIFLALAGAADAVSSVFRQTILQSATPDSMRGRLQGVFIVVVAGGPRLGELVLGAEANWFGEHWAAVIGGLTCVVVLTVVLAIQRRFLAYDARNPQP